MTYWTTQNPLYATEFRQLHNRINRLFGNTWGPAAPAYPAVKVWTNDDGIVVTAEVPGVDAKSLEVTTLKDALTIKGTIGGDSDEGDDDRNWHRRDRRRGDFTRTLQLPYAVDQENVQATLRDGVLEVRLHRTAAQKPRKIDVKAG